MNSNIHEAQKMAEWWLFYPLSGLDISDAEHDVNSPMFGDATIISKGHFQEFLRSHRKSFFLNSHIEDLMLNRADEHRDFHSLIAVRRKMVNHGSTSPRGVRDPIEESRTKAQIAAKQRASVIAAAMSFALLIDNEYWSTCGLTETIYNHRSRSIMVEAKDGQYEYSADGDVGMYYEDRIHDFHPVISREKLKQKLFSSDLSSLSNLLLSQSSGIAASLTQAMKESAIRLSEAMQSGTRTTRILGSVTAIEILISEHGVSFDTIKSRIKALVGQEAYEFFDGDGVLRERHLYVHRGQISTHELSSFKATALSLSCLMRFAEAAPRFKAKSNVLDYLDFLSFGAKMESIWDEEEKKRFLDYYKHSRDRIQFRYFEGLAAYEAVRKIRQSRTP